MHEFCRGGIFKKISDTWVHISILYVIIINKNNYVDKENTPKVDRITFSRDDFRIILKRWKKKYFLQSLPSSVNEEYFFSASNPNELKDWSGFNSKALGVL